MGKRLGTGIPKALVKLAGKPLIRWSAEVLAGAESMDLIMAIAPAGYEEDFTEILAGISRPILIITGGKARTDSVRNGIEALPRNCNIVGIHDAARPLVEIPDIDRVFRAAEEFGAAALAVPVADTLKLVENDAIKKTVDRSGMWAVQTPQVFRRELIEKAVADIPPGGSYTDTCSLVERLGKPIHVVCGSRNNIKITYPEDLELAEALIARKI